MEKLRNLAFLYLFISLSFFPKIASSEKFLDYQDQYLKKNILEGIDACFRENYPLAEERFEQVLLKAQQDPAGHFFLAMLYQAQMMDFESDFREKDFYEKINAAKKCANERIKSNRRDAWACLFLGNAYAAKAVHEARKGNWLSGLNNGLKAKSVLNEAIKVDPDLYEAYVGLGSFHYWASVVIPSWAGWLPFLGDKREEGIAEMELAQKRSIFSQDAAANGLIWVYINEKEYDQAIGLAEKMQNKYPEGKSFLWALATAYYEKSDWTNALFFYQEILKRIEMQIDASTLNSNHPGNPHNYYNHIECKFHIANCLFNLGRFKECILTCEEIQNCPLDEKTKERQKDKLKGTKRLLEKSLRVLGREAEK